MRALANCLQFLRRVSQILQHQVLALCLLRKGEVKDEVAEVFLVHQLEVLAEVEARQVAVGLADEVELVTRDHLQIVQFYEEPIVLDTLNADHNEVLLGHLDDLTVDDVLTLVLGATARGGHSLLEAGVRVALVLVSRLL